MLTAGEQVVLALDTSTAVASVALYDGDAVLAETTWLGGRTHATRLLGEIDAALTLAGRTSDDIAGIAVARGPGSFTGVRVGLSVAKGMAAGLNIPVWGVGTLAVLAWSVVGQALPIRPVVEAGRGRFATALFAGQVCVETARTVTLAELADLARQPCLVVGELPPAARARLAADDVALLASPAAGARRAGYLAELGWRAAAVGDPGDPAAVDALYLGAGA